MVRSHLARGESSVRLPYFATSATRSFSIIRFSWPTTYSYSVSLSAPLTSTRTPRPSHESYSLSVFSFFTASFGPGFTPSTMNSKRAEMRNNSQRGFSVRRTPRACHGACDRLRPGRLRASHAVCLASRTLEPAICARKEEADIESVSTTERILEEGLVMQRDFSDSGSSNRILRHEPPLHSTSLASELQFGETANNGAAENCSARHGSCYSYSGVSCPCHLFRSSYAPSSLHLRSYRAALRSL